MTILKVDNVGNGVELSSSVLAAVLIKYIGCTGFTITKDMIQDVVTNHDIEIIEWPSGDLGAVLRGKV